MNTRLKSIALTLGLMLAGGAQATDTDLGDITGVIFPPSSTGKSVGSFLDRYFFQISAPSTGSVTAADFQISNPSGGYFWNIDDLSADILFDLGTIGTYDPGLDDMVYVHIGDGDFIQNSGPLFAANYYMRVTGDATGTFGGVYTWHAAALPVPEPETWAMLLAGVGLVGLQLRRKQKTATRIAIN